MKNDKEVTNSLTRTQIISAIIWAVILIAYNFQDNDKMNIILLSGAFVEFLVLSSSFREIRNKIKSNAKNVK